MLESGIGAAAAFVHRGAGNVVPLRRNVLRVPACAQCRAAMTVDRFEPGLKEAALVATFRCLECGLRDRVTINPGPDGAGCRRLKELERVEGDQ